MTITRQLPIKMKSTKVQTLGAGHALAKHLVESEDIWHYVEIKGKKLYLKIPAIIIIKKEKEL